jgi:energy-converting hydrogenase Eha subunit H
LIEILFVISKPEMNTSSGSGTPRAKNIIVSLSELKILKLPVTALLAIVTLDMATLLGTGRAGCGS